jgi:hypothetical protein
MTFDIKYCDRSGWNSEACIDEEIAAAILINSMPAEKRNLCRRQDSSKAARCEETKKPQILLRIRMNVVIKKVLNIQKLNHVNVILMS